MLLTCVVRAHDARQADIKTDQILTMVKFLHDVFPICKRLCGIGELVTRHFRMIRYGDFFGDA